MYKRQPLKFGEFKAVLCRLAHLSCKGKTLGDRVDMFVNTKLQ